MERYVIVPAVVYKNQIIPAWDSRIVYNKDDYHGNHIGIVDEYERFFEFSEVVFDLKTKTISLGIEVEIFPETLSFNKGDEVLFEINTYHVLEPVTVIDVLFEEYESTIKKGKKLDQWYRNKIEGEVENEQIYHIKRYVPTFILSNGQKTKYVHQLYRLKK